jgi:hypothetical protein
MSLRDLQHNPVFPLDILVGSAHECADEEFTLFHLKEGGKERNDDALPRGPLSP